MGQARDRMDGDEVVGQARCRQDDETTASKNATHHDGLVRTVRKRSFNSVL